MRIFERWYFCLVLRLEISYRVIIISWRILVFFQSIFWRLYFCMVKYLSFHNSSFFCLKILFNVNGKAKVWHTPCLFIYEITLGLSSTPCRQPDLILHLLGLGPSVNLPNFKLSATRNVPFLVGLFLIEFLCQVAEVSIFTSQSNYFVPQYLNMEDFSTSEQQDSATKSDFRRGPKVQGLMNSSSLTGRKLWIVCKAFRPGSKTKKWQIEAKPTWHLFWRENQPKNSAKKECS
jgi:hypothetical protein